MRYYVRVCIGSLISLVCLGFALYALYQLIRGGSCASGGNYVSVRQCPPGTEKWAWVLPGAIIGGLLSFFLGTFKGFGPADRSRAGGPVRPGVAPFNPVDLFGGRAVVVRGQVVNSDRAPHDGLDPIVRLRQLRELLDAGTLSVAEFELAKAKILKGM